MLVNLDSRPWKHAGFDSSWRRFRMDLELTKLVAPGLTPHGLRHSFASDLREKAHATEREIADALGQTSTGVVGNYTRTIDMTASNRAVLKRLYV